MMQDNDRMLLLCSHCGYLQWVKGIHLSTHHQERQAFCLRCNSLSEFRIPPGPRHERNNSHVEVKEQGEYIYIKRKEKKMGIKTVWRNLLRTDIAVRLRSPKENYELQRLFIGDKYTITFGKSKIVVRMTGDRAIEIVLIPASDVKKNWEHCTY